MDSTNNYISFELILLTLVLGIVSVIINVYALYKKNNEFTARILSPEGTITNLEEYLTSGGIEFIEKFITENFKDINYIIADNPCQSSSEDCHKRTTESLYIVNNDNENALTFNKDKKNFSFSAKTKPTTTTTATATSFKFGHIAGDDTILKT